MRCLSSRPNSARLPMKRRRTSLRCRSATSRTSASRNNPISTPTSSGGRRQFSLLKANSVKYRTWRCAHSSTILRTTLTLARWPATRGRPRDRAQRPLPSMMIATCCGESAMGVFGVRVLLRSDLHQLLFLVRHGLIDVRDVLVRQFLNVILGAPVIVLRNELFLEHFLQLAHDFA